MFCIYMPACGIYMPPGIMLFLKWSMEKACEASCCAYGVWEKDVTFASSHISRASDFWVVICHTKKFRPIRRYAPCSILKGV